MDQIKSFKVNLNTCGIKEDENKEVVDHLYVEKIECLTMPELNWNKREEDDLFSRMSEVLRRTENWLKMKMNQPDTLRTPKNNLKTKQKNSDKEKNATLNLNDDDPIVGSEEDEFEATTPQIQLQVQLKVANTKRTTRSSTKSRRAMQIKGGGRIIIELDSSEAKEVAEKTPRS